jgi:hypothetical protein
MNFIFSWANSDGYFQAEVTHYDKDGYYHARLIYTCSSVSEKVYKAITEITLIACLQILKETYDFCSTLYTDRIWSTWIGLTDFPPMPTILLFLLKAFWKRGMVWVGMFKNERNLKCNKWLHPAFMYVRTNCTVHKRLMVITIKLSFTKFFHFQNPITFFFVT